MFNMKKRNKILRGGLSVAIFSIVVLVALALSLAYGGNAAARAESNITAPQNIAVSLSPDAVTISWTPVTITVQDAQVTYRVYRNGTLISGDLTTTSFSFNRGQLQINMPYIITVSAVARTADVETGRAISSPMTIRVGVSPSSPAGLTPGGVAGIVIGAIVVLVLVALAVLFYLKKKKEKETKPFEKNQKPVVINIKTNCLREAKEELYQCSELYDIALAQVEQANCDSKNEIFKNQAMNTILKLLTQVEKARVCVDKYKEEVCGK